MKLFKKIVVRLFAYIFIACLGVGIYFTAKGYHMYREALAETGLDEMAAVIRADANYTELEELPQIYLNAVIATEDHRFYRHPGVDVIAIGRALWHDLRAFSFVEGGSTITQQLAKNQYFTQQKQVERKVADAFMALALERHFSKDEILELYVNSIYFGNGYHGIAEASQGYYGQVPGNLTDYEATMLAGIPNAPSVYALTANPDLAEKRQQRVLDLMVERGYLSTETAQAILARQGSLETGSSSTFELRTGSFWLAATPLDKRIQKC